MRIDITGLFEPADERAQQKAAPVAVALRRGLALEVRKPRRAQARLLAPLGRHEEQLRAEVAVSMEEVHFAMNRSTMRKRHSRHESTNG